MGRTPGAKNKKTLERERLQNQQTEPPEQTQTEPKQTADGSETQKEKIQDIKNEFNNIKIDSEIKEETKQKKRSGYKSKKVKEAEFQASITGVGAFLLGIIINRLPNPKPLSIEESQNFDTMFSKVAYKYSSILGEYQEETALLAISAMIIFPRLKKPESINDET